MFKRLLQFVAGAGESPMTRTPHDRSQDPPHKIKTSAHTLPTIHILASLWPGKSTSARTFYRTSNRPKMLTPHAQRIIESPQGDRRTSQGHTFCHLQHWQSSKTPDGSFIRLYTTCSPSCHQPFTYKVWYMIPIKLSTASTCTGIWLDLPPRFRSKTQEAHLWTFIHKSIHS
jgi:hypothetical protein